MERVEELKRHIAALVKALEPFAAIAEECDEDYADVLDFSDGRIVVAQRSGPEIGELSIDDFRAARRAADASLYPNPPAPQ